MGKWDIKSLCRWDPWLHTCSEELWRQITTWRIKGIPSVKVYIVATPKMQLATQNSSIQLSSGIHVSCYSEEEKKKSFSTLKCTQSSTTHARIVRAPRTLPHGFNTWNSLLQHILNPDLHGECCASQHWMHSSTVISLIEEPAESSSIDLGTDFQIPHSVFGWSSAWRS